MHHSLSSWWSIEDGSMCTPINRWPRDTVHYTSLVHDLTNHFPKDDGSFEMEFMALGAYIYIGDLSGNYLINNIEAIGEDIANVYSYCHRGLKPCLGKKRIKKGFDLELCKDFFDTYILSGDLEYDNQQLNIAMDWFQHGYYKASQRYRGVDRTTLRENSFHMRQTLKNEIRKCDGIVRIWADIRDGSVIVERHNYFYVWYIDGLYKLASDFDLLISTRSYATFVRRLSQLNLSHLSKEL